MAAKKKAAKKAAPAPAKAVASASSDWSANNAAACATWVALTGLSQITEVFAKSAGVKMQQLTFWVTGSSAQMGQLLGGAIAVQLDNLFRMYEDAKYEEGKDRTTAVGAMTGILSQAEKTCAELASAVDDHYRFVDEPTAPVG